MKTLSTLTFGFTLALAGALAACGGADTLEARVTPAQAAELTQARAGQVIDVNLDCCGAEGADLAMKIAFGLQAAADLRNDAPVLVHGRDTRQASDVAERLAAAGYSHIVVVTQ
jgi:hypothetical protein